MFNYKHLGIKDVMKWHSVLSCVDVFPIETGSWGWGKSYGSSLFYIFSIGKSAKTRKLVSILAFISKSMGFCLK